jgi:fructosamine-3-kinase
MNVREDILRAKIDPYLTDATLSALATEALGVRTRSEGYSVLTGGLWNRVISVPVTGTEKHLVVKVTPQHDDPALRREFEVLRYFRSHTALPVPEPYLLDLSGARVPGSVLVMAQAPGKVLSAIRETLTSVEQRHIGEEIAAHLGALHTHQALGFGGVEEPVEQRSATWAAFWIPRYDSAVAEARDKNLLDSELLAGLTQLRCQLPALLAIGPRGTLTHYDIWTGNVIVDRRDDRVYVSAFVDVMGYYADYARELSSMFSLADAWLMQAYRQYHPFDAGFRERFAAYSLKMSLQLASMYPSEQHYVEDARQFLRQTLASCMGGQSG